MGLVIIDEGGEKFMVPLLFPVIELTKYELVALYRSNNPGGGAPRLSVWTKPLRHS
jgi:hypothetical protein